MCGIAGFLYTSCFPQNANDLLSRMGQAMHSRGPDSSGVWSCKINRVGLSHQRLAIVDLTPAGHQPMVSNSKRYVISFNGEIYNHEDIREEIEKEQSTVWKGHSDTETLLAGIELWGLEITLKKTIGMFALAIWDNDTKAIYLARDRFGEKPLYYSQQDDLFIFGSELKSFRVNPDFKAVISRDSLSLLLRHSYIPAPYSIYQNVSKLMPGTFATFKNGNLAIQKYWSATDSFNISEEQLLKENDVLPYLESKLKSAIKKQMVADVPLGAFLSGGIDSSLIVALMQSMTDRPVKTFSIGFNESEFNEAHYAKEVANHLGTEHTELYVSAKDALDVVEKLTDIYDEPFSDSSQIPTFLVTEMAKKHVTVSLSGDAGDELFCGYNRYLMTAKTWGKINKMPFILRQSIAKILLAVPSGTWNSLNRLMPSKYKMSNLGDKLHKAAGVITCTTIDELYKGLVSHWHNPENIVLASKEPLTVLTDPTRKTGLKDPILEMMALDTLSYMTDDILVKVDRAAMANSLEVRVPFLDHTVFEAAWRIPLTSKLKGSSTKDCLREILFKYVPRELIERPKTGFGIPLEEWLRGPLSDWANKLLNRNRLEEEGFFDAEKIAFMWEQHKTGERNWHYLLWDVLMFQIWFEKHHK